jgi:hypothetical protein
MQASITEDIRTFLGDTGKRAVDAYTLTRSALDDIYTSASRSNMTLYRYIAEDPERAVRECEECVREWTQVLATAALRGCIVTEEGEVPVNKDITSLLRERLKDAHATLKKVEQLSASAAASGVARKDQLVQTLFNQAVREGNTKAMLYLIDRVEGRPTEAKKSVTAEDNMLNIYNLLQCLFDKQLEVLNSGPGTKICCCSRRSGKTHLACSQLLIEALRVPNTTCIYIGTTLKISEGLVKTAMNEIIDLAKLKDSKGERLDWQHLENNSKILIRGLSSTRDPDMIRGHRAKVIVIDEFFHIANDGLLEYMMTDVLEPMQLDYAGQNYTMLFLGTPPNVRGTYGEKMWQESSIPHFHWIYKDNPHGGTEEDKKAYIEAKLAEKGLGWDSTYARREYLGEFAYDDEALLYPVFHTYDAELIQPPLEITDIYCGIDYGMTDSTAVIGVAWNKELRRGYVFFETKANRLQVDKGITMLQFLKDEVRALWDFSLDLLHHMPPEEANKHIIWEADSSDQSLTEELEFNVHCMAGDKLRLNIMDAHKVDKVLMHDKIRDLLRSSALLLPYNSKTAGECEKVVMIRDEQGRLLPEIDEEFYHPDLLDALRYAMWPAIGAEVINMRGTGSDAFSEAHTPVHWDFETHTMDNSSVDGSEAGSLDAAVDLRMEEWGNNHDPSSNHNGTNGYTSGAREINIASGEREALK